MKLWLPFVVLPQVYACIVTAGGRRYDFTNIDGRQITTSDPDYKYSFSFCRPNSDLCYGESSSLCQQALRGGFETSLGLWSNVSWSSSPEGLTGLMKGELCLETGAPRETTLRFVCQNTTTAFVSIKENPVCTYEAVIAVPFGVCGACCSPASFAKRVMVKRGDSVAAAIVQQDSQIGDSYDGRGELVRLCSKYYNRCFSFDATTCTGSAYSPPPPPECVSAAGWVGSYPLVRGTSVNQSVWGVGGGGYAITVPLADGCIIVGGTNRDASLDVSATPDEALWEIPEQCLREAKKKF